MGQIPYDLPFNWNIINRRKKQQNITRDIEVKNNLTIARGEWGGDSGVRVFQDTWTKPRGRMEVGEGGGFSSSGVEGWGEKAHNCNRITIKN